LYIAVLSNVWSAADRSQVRAISNELSAMALGEGYERPRKHKEMKINTAIYDAYTGEYSGKDKFAIAREGDRLVVRIPQVRPSLRLSLNPQRSSFGKEGSTT
jgi:hypothetical protein